MAAFPFKIRFWPGRREPLAFGVVRSVVSRGLGGIYAVAFASWWVQAHGLVGSRGIAPMGPWLSAVREQLGPGAVWQVPTVFLWGAGDGSLHAVCAAGVAAAVLVVAGVGQGPLLVVLWALYLSLVTTGNVFMNFQWDALLLEAGLIAPFLAPWRPWTGPRRIDARVPRLPVYLLWLLLGKLMFLSGLVKLTSGDVAWRDGSALVHHYETQPLPHVVAWYVHQGPAWFHALSVWIMFVVELAFPLLIPLGRQARRVAAAGFVGLMVLIAGTGNFTYFNLLTALLSLTLLDDAAWPVRVREWFRPGPEEAGNGGGTMAGACRAMCLGPLAVLSLAVCLDGRVAGGLRPVLEAVAPFRSVNSYGLFRVMTRERPEILVEGSRDGVTWLLYEHRFKPDRPEEAPAFAAPHQPRLDWQFWFAALDAPYRRTPHSVWFEGLLLRLLEGEETVLRLFATNPFPEEPPRFLRARLCRYSFTTPEERRAGGAWWRREDLGLYVPVVERSPSRGR
jgi:hypothetical protein